MQKVVETCQIHSHEFLSLIPSTYLYIYIYIPPFAAFMENNFLVVAALFVTYGFVLTNFSYLISFLFKKRDAASRWSGFFVSITVTFTFLFVTLFLRNNLSEMLSYVLCVIPTFSLYHGVMMLGLAIVEAQPITLMSVVTFQPGFGRRIGVTIAIMFFEALVFFIAVM